MASKNDNAARMGLFGLAPTEMLLMSHSLAEVLSFAAAQGTLVHYDNGQATVTVNESDDGPESTRETVTETATIHTVR